MLSHKDLDEAACDEYRIVPGGSKAACGIGQNPNSLAGLVYGRKAGPNSATRDILNNSSEQLHSCLIAEVTHALLRMLDHGHYHPRL